jgi:hypothetical protein
MATVFLPEEVQAGVEVEGIIEVYQALTIFK